MSFPIQCPNCSTKLRAKDSHIGKKLACPKCKHPFVVQPPEPDIVESATPSPAHDPLMDAGFGNLDLGDLASGGSGDESFGESDLGSFDYTGVSPGTLAGPASSSYSSRQQQSAVSDAGTSAGAAGMSRALIGVIAAGAAGALCLLAGVVVLAIWFLRPPADSGEQISIVESQPAAAPAAVETSSGPQLSDWPAFAESENLAGREVYAAFVPPAGDTRSLALASSDRKEFEPGPPRNHRLSSGAGFPLAPRPKDWFTGEPIIRAIIYESANRQREQMIPATRWVVDQPTESKLIQTKVDGDGYTVVRLTPIGTPSADRLREIEKDGGPALRSDHQHLWSRDGSHLYVLAGTERRVTQSDWPNQLLKINARTWTIEQRLSVKLPSLGGRETGWNKGARILDMAWCSRGLAVLLEGSMRSSLTTGPDGAIWFPLMTGLRNSASLVVVDPANLQVKQAWAVPALLEISGAFGEPFVYLQNRGEYLCVINVQKGELISMIRRSDSMKMPTVTPDGKWLLSHGADALHRFRLVGHEVILEQSRGNIGKRSVIASGDGQYAAFRGRDKYYAVQTDDLNKSVGTLSSQDVGQMAVDPVNKTVFVCSADPAANTLNLQIHQSHSSVQVALDTVANDQQQTPQSTNRRSGSAAPKLHEHLCPIAMSAEPTGRGAIIFAENAAYWVETRTKGEAWAFDAREPAQVSVVEQLADTSANEARLTLPQPIERPFEIRAVCDDAPGRVFQLPANHFLRAVDVDPLSGDLAVYSVGGTKERYGAWLYICRAAELGGDVARPQSALLFEGAAPLSMRFKKFADRMLLLVARDDALWVVDPRTLRLAEEDGTFQTRIDFKSSKYDDRLRPPRDPRAAPTKEPDGSWAIYTSRDLNDPTTVLGRGQFSLKDGYHLRFQVDLAQGEITKSLTVPASRLENAASISYGGAIQDPYEELSVDREGVARGEVTRQWTLPPASHYPLAVLQKRPWIVTRGAQHVHFYNRHELSERIDVAFPKLLQNSSFQASFVCEGAGRDQLIFGGNPGVTEHREQRWGVLWILSAGDAGIPDRPLLVAQLEMPENIEPGKAVSIPIHLPDRRAQVAIADGPVGARLADGTLEWTPQQADVGTHALVLRLSAGETAVERSFPYTVRYSEIPLEFEPLSVHVSHDGRQALAWTNLQIALVDVRERKMLATRKVNHPIAKAILTGSEAFLLYGHTVERCSLDDLNPVETLALTKPIQNIDALQDRFLFLTAGEGVADFHVFELPDLQPSQRARMLSGPLRTPQVSQTPDGWLIGPAILDQRLQSIISLHSLGWANPFYLSSPPLNATGTSVTRNRSSRTATVLVGPGRSRAEPTAELAGGQLNVRATLQEIVERSQRFSRKRSLTLSFTETSVGKTVEFPFSQFEARHYATAVAASGKGVVITAAGRLFTLFPEDFGISISAAPELKGLTLRAKVPLTALSATDSSRIQFAAAGGTPPYEYKCEMDLNSLGHRTTTPAILDKFLQVSSRDGSVTVDGALFVEALLSAENHSFRGVLQQFVEQRGARSDAAESVDQYTSEVGLNLQPLLRGPLRDFPVVVPLVVSVTDAESKEVKLAHNLLLELPRQRIVELLEGLFSRGRTAIAQQPLDRLGTQLPPAPQLPLIWNDGTQIELASEIRRLWPRIQFDDPTWSVERLAACSAIMASERQIVEIRDPRLGNELPEKTWRTTDGKEVVGRLVGANERDVSVRAGNESFSQRLGLRLLDEESLQQAWIALQRLRREYEYSVRKGTTTGRTSKPQSHDIGIAISQFRNHYGCLPPRAIVDQTGKPLLSWRVLLLPYLGHSKLFHLFRLDEPWDSEHNRKLIPFMPLVYNPNQTGVPLGRTTFKALAGPQTAFPEQGLRRYHDFENDPASVLLIVEVDKSAAAEWTRPDDLAKTEDRSWVDQLLTRKVDDEDYYQGIYGDGVYWLFRINDEDN